MTSDETKSLEYSVGLQLEQRGLFKDALDDRKYADVTIRIGEEERSVIGALLASISPVFDGMLFGGIKNTRPDPNVPIKIEHIDPETFDCTLFSEKVMHILIG